MVRSEELTTQLSMAAQEGSPSQEPLVSCEAITLQRATARLLCYKISESTLWQEVQAAGAHLWRDARYRRNADARRLREAPHEVPHLQLQCTGSRERD